MCDMCLKSKTPTTKIYGTLPNIGVITQPC